MKVLHLDMLNLYLENSNEKFNYYYYQIKIFLLLFHYQYLLIQNFFR